MAAPLGVLAGVAFDSFLGDLAGGDVAAACAFVTFAADLEGPALGDLTGVALGCALGDLRGVSTAAGAGAARPVFFVFEGAAFCDCFVEADDAAATGEARGDARLADAGALDTPPFTADLGVFGLLAGEALAAAGDLAEPVTGDLATTLLDFPRVAFVAAFGDLAGAFPLRAGILSNTKIQCNCKLLQYVQRHTLKRCAQSTCQHSTLSTAQSPHRLHPMPA